jgi:DUF971 family protein
VQPTNFNQTDATELAIEWQGGSISRIPTRELRLRCPCASCRTMTSGLIPMLPPAAMRIREIILVGSSAIRVIWEDGHAMGIYRYSQLQHLFPPTPQG